MADFSIAPVPVHCFSITFVFESISCFMEMFVKAYFPVIKNCCYVYVAVNTVSFHPLLNIVMSTA